MAGFVAGVSCPQCGYDGNNGDMLTELIEFFMMGGVPVAMDLRCGACHFEWRSFEPEYT